MSTDTFVASHTGQYRRELSVIQSVDRAVQILNALQGARHLALSELASRLELSPSTTHGILKTLVGRDLVRQDQQTSRYYLGPAVLRLAGVYLDALDIRTRALPWVKDLVAKTSAPVRIGVLSGNEVILVHHETPTGSQHHMQELGIGLPAHSSSLGKVLLANEEPGVLDGWPDSLMSMTSATIDNLSSLKQELDVVRDKGYALEREEAVIGEFSVAAPVFGSGERVLGGLSVVISSGGPELEQLISPVVDIARAVSRELGASPGR